MAVQMEHLIKQTHEPEALKAELNKLSTFDLNDFLDVDFACIQEVLMLLFSAFSGDMEFFSDNKPRIFIEHKIDSMIHLVPIAFDQIGGEVVSTTSYILRK